MSPRKLQNEIKQDFRADNSVWSAYRTTIINNFAETNYQDLSDHLLREFNRKIMDLGLNEDLLFTPFDAGFRFLGVSIGGDTSLFTYFQPDGISTYNRPDGTSIYNRP
jgi:hypothetical protein